MPLLLAVARWRDRRRRSGCTCAASRRRMCIHFPTLRFLDDEPVPRESPQRLRDLLIFLLRALAVVAIAGAFAWPYLKGPPPAEVSSSRVYILDNTMSNQAGDNFEHGRDEILKAIAQAGGANVQIAVVELKHQPRTVVNFSDSRVAGGKRAAGVGKPSSQRGSFLAAFNQANALLAQSLGQKKEIIIYSDNQENQWGEECEHAAVPEKCRGDHRAAARGEAAPESRAPAAAGRAVFRGRQGDCQFQRPAPPFPWRGRKAPR